MPSPAPVTGPLQTRASLAAALRDLGVRPGETLLAHTSLSSLGWVCGGAVAVVQALLDAVGPDGTLTVPTHSGDNSDPAGWSAPPVPEPWWPAIRAHMPPYDPRTTPSRGVGVVPETLRTGYASCTAFHLAEYRIAGPRVRNSFAVRTPSGPRWTTVTDTSVSDEGFAELGDDFEGSRPVARGTVGGATARLFPLAAAVAHAERWLPVHRPRTA